MGNDGFIPAKLHIESTKKKRGIVSAGQMKKTIRKR